MPDRPRDRAGLEAALRELSAWPPTPDIAAAVRPRLTPRRRRRRRARAWLLGAVTSAVFATAAIEPARSAVLEFLGLKSVRIERQATDPAPRPFGADLDLGRPTSLEDAEKRAGLVITPPSALGDPQSVWLREAPAVVSLVYRRPTTLVQALDARLDAPIIEKAAGPNVNVEPVSGGYFLSGAPHGVRYIGRDGRPVVEQQRLAGNTLIVERDGVLLRIEGRLTRDRALEVANSMTVSRHRP